MEQHIAMLPWILLGKSFLHKAKNCELQLLRYTQFIKVIMTRFSILFMANYSEQNSHLKFKPCFNERNISSTYEK